MPLGSQIRGFLALCTVTLLVAGCSNDGNGGSGGLVATDLGQARIDGVTTTIVAPPGWEGSETEGNDEDQNSGSGFNLGFGGGRGGGDDGGASGSTADLSSITAADAGGFCKGACDIDFRDINHPTWGPTRVFAMRQDVAPKQQQFAAVDGNGDVKWTFDPGPAFEGWVGFGPEEPDASDALFITYMPGKYYETVVVRPSREGFEGLANGGSRSPGLDDTVIFSEGEVGDLDSNGNYEILVTTGNGITTDAYEHYFTWTGSRYEEIKDPVLLSRAN